MNPKKRRPSTLAQKLTKNEGDRKRRREHKMEFERLQNQERELQDLVMAQRNENRSLRDDNEKINENLNVVLTELQKLREQNRKLQQIVDLADSWFDFGNFPSPNEEVANNESIAEGPKASQSGIPTDQHTLA